MNQKEYELIVFVLKLNRDAYRDTELASAAWEVTETLKYEFMRSLAENYPKTFDAERFRKLFDQ